MVEDAHPHARVVRSGNKGDARTQAGAQDTDPRITLLCQPVQARAGIDDGLAGGVDGAILLETWYSARSSSAGMRSAWYAMVMRRALIPNRLSSLARPTCPFASEFHWGRSTNARPWSLGAGNHSALTVSFSGQPDRTGLVKVSRPWLNR